MVVRWLAEGLGWRWFVLRRAAYLLTSFRNGATLADSYRRKKPCDRAVCWDGAVLRHPPGRRGLAETLLEIWFDQVYTRGFYRPAPGDVVIDAGANVGLFSVWLARRFPACRIVAFEPFAENYDLLCANLRSAHVSNVEAHRAGLGGRSGFGRMEDTGPRSLDHRLTTDPGGDASQAGAVRVHSFADALRLAGGGPVALFKIDVEGSEHDLFEHAEPADLARVARFAIEYHDNIRPGTLDLLKRRLADSHDVRLGISYPYGDGMLYATRKTLT
jgi:FkbM family methyltransferase